GGTCGSNVRSIRTSSRGRKDSRWGDPSQSTDDNRIASPKPRGRVSHPRRVVLELGVWLERYLSRDYDMPIPTAAKFDAGAHAYEAYVQGLHEFVEAMSVVGIRVKNVEPFANFAEVIVAREFAGSIQPPANKGFDVLTDDGVRIQVKSLRVSSENKGANGIHW